MLTSGGNKGSGKTGLPFTFIHVEPSVMSSYYAVLIAAFVVFCPENSHNLFQQ